MMQNLRNERIHRLGLRYVLTKWEFGLQGEHFDHSWGWSQNLGLFTVGPNSPQLFDDQLVLPRDPLLAYVLVLGKIDGKYEKTLMDMSLYPQLKPNNLWFEHHPGGHRLSAQSNGHGKEKRKKIGEKHEGGSGGGGGGGCIGGMRLGEYSDGKCGHESQPVQRGEEPAG
ncbi:hypothetical protein AAG906_004711 [Vitis piasezkii]